MLHSTADRPNAPSVRQAQVVRAVQAAPAGGRAGRGRLASLGGVRAAPVPLESTTCCVNGFCEGRRRQTMEWGAKNRPSDQTRPDGRNPPVVHLGPLNQELDASLVSRFPRSLVGVTP